MGLPWRGDSGMVAGGLWENGEMATGDEFDALLVEAGRTPMRGWEYDYGGRIRLEPPPWDFPGRMLERCQAAASLLDMGTGGGEWLSRLPYRPPLTVATEAGRPTWRLPGVAWSPWASAWSRWRARRTTIARAGGRWRRGVAVRRWHLRPGRQPPRVLSAIGGPAGAGARRLFPHPAGGRRLQPRVLCVARRTGAAAGGTALESGFRPRPAGGRGAPPVAGGEGWRCCTSPMSAPWPGTC